MNSPQTRSPVSAELAYLANAFFKAVSFEQGDQPRYHQIHELFVEQGLLIKNSGQVPEIYSLHAFIAPRQASVDVGDLTRFYEAELSETTPVFGNVAQRFSTYVKSGTLKGVAFEAKGMVSTQFIKTPNGWRISSMAWDDERPGLTIEATDPPKLREHP
jgi:hypothetical protein